MFWQPNQAQVHGHYLMIKVKECGCCCRSHKFMFFIFDPNGRLTAYKLYDGTKWRTSKRFGDYGAVRPDEWALSSLNLIQDLFYRHAVTFDFRSYVGHSGCTRTGDHQETVHRVR